MNDGLSKFNMKEYVVNDYTKKYYSNFFSWCGFIDQMKLLFEDGIDYTLFKDEFQNPLQNAVRNNKIEAVRFLLDIGFDVDFKNSEGHTPLMYAVHLGFKDITKLLLERGAINIKQLKELKRKEVN